MGAGTPAYSVSKAALNALTRILAAELRGDRVLVNAVCPGWVATDMGGSGGRPVEDGAASVVWAVRLDDDGPTGGVFPGRRAPAGGGAALPPMCGGGGLAGGFRGGRGPSPAAAQHPPREAPEPRPH